MAKTSLKNELKALGGDIAKAFIVMKGSRELKKLEKDIVAGVKSVSKSLGQALKTASQSQETSQIKKRLHKVVKLGTKEGLAQAKKAESIAAEKIRKARAALRNIVDKRED